MLNPKSQIPNPKQILNPNIQIFKTVGFSHFNFEYLALFRISIFDMCFYNVNNEKDI